MRLSSSAANLKWGLLQSTIRESSFTFVSVIYGMEYPLIFKGHSCVFSNLKFHGKADLQANT